MKLEPNMYVRTNEGIKQIYRIDNNKTKYKYLYKLKKQEGDGCIDCGCLCIEDILKASHNIIDLIEVGDIVEVEFDNDNGMNKFEVVGVAVETNEIGIFKDDYSIYGVDIKNIKSIVTKEQMEAIQYKVV